MSSAPSPRTSPIAASGETLRPAARVWLLMAALIALTAAGVATGAVANGAPDAAPQRQTPA